jgi:hypothetical protein
MFVDYVNLQIQYMSYMSCFSILKYTSPVILTSCEKEGPIIYSFQAQQIFTSGFCNPISNGTMRMLQTAYE